MSVDLPKICLIRVPAVESFRFSTGSIAPPLGLAYIAAAIESSGRKVHLIDAVGEAPTTTCSYVRGYLVGLRFEQIVERVPPETKVIGISIVFTHEWPAAAVLVGLLRTRFPFAKIILGGEHVTAMPEFCLATSPADVAVLGEGEETIIDLLSAIEDGGDLSRIPGTAVRFGEKILTTSRRERRRDIDNICLPAWQHVRLGVYHAHGFVGGMDSEFLTVPILATRGCPYQCTYCSSPRMWSPRWIARDPVKVVDEIEFYVKTRGARNFPFQDLTAILKKDWIIQFCNEVIQRNLSITWLLPTGTRLEAVDEQVAHLLRRSGMVSMAFAPESGSELTREIIRKRMQTEALLQAITDAGKADLNVAIFVVIGFPHETRPLLRENIEFVRRLRDYPVKDLSIGSYMALPGTELFDTLYDSGAIQVDRNWFRSMLDGNSLLPFRSWNRNISRLEFFLAKIQMYFTFYVRLRPSGGGGLGVRVISLFRGVFISRSHSSRLQTALSNALRSGIEVIRAHLRDPWMAADMEAQLFSTWDTTYRRIRVQRIEKGIIQPGPKDSRDLHKRNMVQLVKHEHGTAYSVDA